MLDEKDLQTIDELFAHRLNVVLESAIMPKFNLLAEGQQTILQTMAPKTKTEELEEELDCLCGYSAEQCDADFHIGDKVIIVITKYSYERRLIYGKILARW